MRVLVAILFLLGVAFAQSPPVLTLENALARSPAYDPDVLSAQADVEAAARNLVRQRADPLALGVATLKAESAVADAQANLASTRLGSRSETSSLYFDVVTADAAGVFAEETLALAEANLEATRIRAEVGAATDLEALQARNSRAEAERNLESAQQESRLAYRELADALGLSTTELILRGLGPVPLGGPPLPTLAGSLSRAQRENAGLLAARQAIKLAEAQFRATDNAFSARVDIEAAADEVERAKSALETTGQRLALSVRRAQNTIESAARSFQNALATRQAYDAELAAQRARLAAGTIAPLDFRQAGLTGLQHDQSLYSALYALHQSALALEGTIAGSAAGGEEVSASTSDGELGMDSAADDVLEEDASDVSTGDAPAETDEFESDTPAITVPETVAPTEDQNDAP